MPPHSFLQQCRYEKINVDCYIKYSNNIKCVGLQRICLHCNLSGERCLKYVKNEIPTCRVPRQKGGPSHFEAIPVTKLFDEETKNLVRSKTDDEMIKINPYCDNEGCEVDAPPKDEFVMNEQYKGSIMR